MPWFKVLVERLVKMIYLTFSYFWANIWDFTNAFNKPRFRNSHEWAPREKSGKWHFKWKIFTLSNSQHTLPMLGFGSLYPSNHSWTLFKLFKTIFSLRSIKSVYHQDKHFWKYAGEGIKSGENLKNRQFYNLYANVYLPISH